ncbi:hypothetical protein MXL46_13935 [Heyndrickxia sporothermodurans]|uniref:hypothetical protein n=1 Tax=Heyndrickxia sporothermodurans TaxID=46224 RepID=UPI002DBB5081|nr:hypothetical protein [Heyndrickxia sporothermodurans]MEB6550191.1 hypothetical protein [Heyndrickxia sporothermodurans]
MLDNIKDQVFTNVVKEDLENEINQVGESISLILKKYAHLFDGNYNKLLMLLIESYINNYDENTNTFTLDFTHILAKVPQESKDKLFAMLIEKFSKGLKIVDFTKEDKLETVEINNEEIEKPNEVFDF